MQGGPVLEERTQAPSLLSVDIGFDDLQVCADPGVPDNGFRTPVGGGFLESSVTQFHCQDGFTLKGPTKRLCVRHLNGTLGWIPSDKPFCAQEGKVPAAALGGRSRGRGDRPHQPRGRDPGRTVPANPACWRERGGAAGAGGEGGSVSQVTVSLLYRDYNLGRPVSVRAGEQLRSQEGCLLLRCQPATRSRPRCSRKCSKRTAQSAGMQRRVLLRSAR